MIFTNILKKIIISISLALLFGQQDIDLIKQKEINPPQEEIIENKEVIEEPEVETVIEEKKEVSTPPKKASKQKVETQKNWWSYPTDIKPTKRHGDDLLVLVNKEYVLSADYVPADLVSAAKSGIRKGNQHMVRNIVIADLTELVKAANNDGIDLSIRSGYRSYSTQVSTYQYWLRYNNKVADNADKVSARAGHSQHQLGTAIDFSTSEIQDGIGGRFHTTKAAKWLEENAWCYGFVISFPQGYESVTGYNYESWHYRYIGKDNALEMINSGKILEVYLREKN
ncbi:MAG: M15 family metallopeptidase [Candidatus Dojkabacteria bacterium]|jgi:D-alanyl-D-alanine carboxypeptidase